MPIGINFFEVNIMSGVRLTRHYLQRMIERREGRVVFIASEAAVTPPQDMAHYSATKSMQLSISRSLAELTAGTSVTVNTVMPGSTLTEGVEAWLKNSLPKRNDDNGGSRKAVYGGKPANLHYSTSHPPGGNCEFRYVPKQSAFIGH